jgi:hypothetical protein
MTKICFPWYQLDALFVLLDKPTSDTGMIQGHDKKNCRMEIPLTTRVLSKHNTCDIDNFFPIHRSAILQIAPECQ